MKNVQYSVWWSGEDEAWLATEIGRPGGTVHGDTPEEALREAIEVASEWDEAGLPLTSADIWDADAVRDLRRSLAMTQREFAELLNISLSTVSAWEQGQRVPTGPTMRLLDFVKATPGLARRFGAPAEHAVGIG